MRRGRHVIVVVGVLLALGGIAYAQSLVEARVNGNSVETDELVPPPSGIELAVKPFFESCYAQDLEYAPVLADPLFDGVTLDYSLPDGLAFIAPLQLCLRNTSTTENYLVIASTVNVVSDEGKNCPDATEEEYGDTTCGPGEGELGDGQLEIRYSRAGETNPAGGWCATEATGQFRTSFDLVEGGGGPVAMLGPTGLCTFGISLDSTTVEPSWVSSSDTLSFDIVFLGGGAG